MSVNVKPINGNWSQGFALDKHTLKSEYIGDDEHGHPQFNTTRTDAGEAVYQLKYQGNARHAKRLAAAVQKHILPLFSEVIHIIVPMPASNARRVQPVSLIANELGALTGLTVVHDLLVKTPNGVSLKNLNTLQEKLQALNGTMSINQSLTGAGPFNVLVVDDLFDSGASMQVATQTLKGYAKIGNVFIAAMTWK